MKKTVLILGASGGIGAEITKKLSEAYALVLHANHQRSKIDDFAHDLNSRGLHASTIYADLSNPSDTTRFIAELRTRFPSIDGIVTAQGIAHYGLFQDATDEEVNALFAINVFATIRILRALIPNMIHNKHGNIVLISSLWGISGASCESIYSATKGAINALTKSLALELAPSGVKVNAIAPGAVDTPMLDPLGELDRSVLLEEIPQHRITSPVEIAEMVSFLLSDMCPTLTGQIISLNGGLYV